VALIRHAAAKLHANPLVAAKSLANRLAVAKLLPLADATEINSERLRIGSIIHVEFPPSTLF
jgi:hypothetical protein